MTIAPIFGILGDGATFAGAILLAVEALRSEHDFDRVRAIGQGLQHPIMQNVRVAMDGLVVTGEADAQRAFLRRATRRAVWGTWCLAVGFGLLFTTRVLEIIGK